MSDRKKQQEMIDALQAICEEMGWVVGIPTEEGSDEIVDGIILGTEEFVYGVVDSVQKNYEFFSKNLAEEEMKELPPPKKKVTFHW